MSPLVTKEDFERIPEILESPDSISYGGKDKRGLDIIRYEKQFNGTTYIAEEVRTGRKELAFQSMWKRSTAKNAPEEPSSVSPETLRRPDSTIDKGTLYANPFALATKAYANIIKQEPGGAIAGASGGAITGGGASEEEPLSSGW